MKKAGDNPAAITGGTDAVDQVRPVRITAGPEFSLWQEMVYVFRREGDKLASARKRSAGEIHDLWVGWWTRLRRRDKKVLGDAYSANLDNGIPLPQFVLDGIRRRLGGTSRGAKKVGAPRKYSDTLESIEARVNQLVKEGLTDKCARERVAKQLERQYPKITAEAIRKQRERYGSKARRYPGQK